MKKAKPATPARSGSRKLKSGSIATTADLRPDKANPRTIQDKAAKGLSVSMDRFGDLSGIVWNTKTRELVAGHQRMQQIENRWGPQKVEAIDEPAGLFGIRVDADHFFAVRVVNWSKAKQRAANVAANNQKIAGEFTDGLEAYLLEIRDEAQRSDSTLFDDLLLSELLVADEAEKEPKQAQLTDSYQIIVQCNDETHQRTIYEALSKQGLACRVLTI